MKYAQVAVSEKEDIVLRIFESEHEDLDSVNPYEDERINFPVASNHRIKKVENISLAALEKFYD